MKRLTAYALSILPAFALICAANAEDGEKVVRNKSPKGAKAYIVGVKDGKTVKKKFKVIFGLTGMGVCPAGLTASGVPIPNTGHHHLLVDVEKLPPMNQPLPADKPDTIKHFGKGQTETVLELSPGKHTLQLILGDWKHVPHDPPVMSKKITITVK